MPDLNLAAIEAELLLIQEQAAAKARQSASSLRLDLPPLYPAQERIKGEARRFNVLDIGRRAGKTYLGIRLALETAAAGHPVGWFAPSYKYVLEVWRDLQRPAKPVATKINATERRIELENGGLIEVWTLENEDAGRGRKYKRAIVDEAAMVPKLKSSWEESIRPTLTDLQGDAWFLSTPKGLNHFHDLFQRGQDSLAYPDWQSWQMPSSVNPFLPSVEIEAARKELPEAVFRQEYLAEFLQNEGAVFRNIAANMTAAVTSPRSHVGHTVVAGVDWGRSHDFTAISIICCTCEQEVKLDRFNQIGWDFQRERILALFDLWHVGFAYVESNSIGSPNLEALRQVAPERLSLSKFETTAQSKPVVIQALALALEKQRIAWLPDDVARHELASYEATVTETGHIRYSAPPGGWDDTVIARALAWSAAVKRLPLPLTDTERLEAVLPESYQRKNAPDAPGDSWRRDGWEMMRLYKLGEARKAVRAKQRDYNDPWEGGGVTEQIGGFWQGMIRMSRALLRLAADA